MEDGSQRPGYDSIEPAPVQDDDEEDEEVPSEQVLRERTPLETIFVYIMKQSYAASLIIMMVRNIKAASHEKVPNDLGRCHTKRTMIAGMPILPLV